MSKRSRAKELTTEGSALQSDMEGIGPRALARLMDLAIVVEPEVCRKTIDEQRRAYYEGLGEDDLRHTLAILASLIPSVAVAIQNELEEGEGIDFREEVQEVEECTAPVADADKREWENASFEVRAASSISTTLLTPFACRRRVQLRAWQDTFSDS